MIYQHGTAEADRGIANSMDAKIKKTQGRAKKTRRKDDPEDDDGPAGVLAPTG